MHGMLRVPRSRGVLSGVLLILLGAWGALVPFVGPYFQYAYTPDHAWTYTTGRLWLSILPGAATVLGGLIVLISASRPLAHFGAWLAALSGAWFALGSVIGPTWIGTQMATGTPVGGSSTRALEQIGFYTGLGVAIVLVAGMALGRFSVIGVRDARRAAPAEPVTPAERTEPAEPVATGGAAHTSALDKPATADKPATTGTGVSRRFAALRRKEPTTGTAEPATEPVSPGKM
jgi:MFS family permease